MTEFPQHISFLSDDSEVEFVNEIKGSKVTERAAVYKYIISRVNHVDDFSLFLSHIIKLNDSKLIVCDGWKNAPQQVNN